MADHIITLSDKREAALQVLLDKINKDPFTGQIVGTKTKDDLLKEWCLTPIIEEIRRERALVSEARQTAIEAAPKAVLDQVDVLLAPYTPPIVY